MFPLPCPARLQVSRVEGEHPDDRSGPVQDHAECLLLTGIPKGRPMYIFKGKHPCWSSTLDISLSMFDESRVKKKKRPGAPRFAFSCEWGGGEGMVLAGFLNINMRRAR